MTRGLCALSTARRCAATTSTFAEDVGTLWLSRVVSYEPPGMSVDTLAGLAGLVGVGASELDGTPAGELEELFEVFGVPALGKVRIRAEHKAARAEVAAGGGGVQLAEGVPPRKGDGQLEALHTEALQGKAGYADPKHMANNPKAACHITVEGADGWHGSGSLVDGSPLGFPRTCILTNQHVLPTKDAARRATVRFNYESADAREWIGMTLDPQLGFICHKDADLDFCLVACSDEVHNSQQLAQTLSKAAKTAYPAALEMNENAAVAAGMPATIWQHPRGGFKQMSQWTLDAVTSTRLEYLQDTEPGATRVLCCCLLLLRQSS